MMNSCRGPILSRRYFGRFFSSTLRQISRRHEPRMSFEVHVRSSVPCFKSSTSTNHVFVSRRVLSTGNRGGPDGPSPVSDKDIQLALKAIEDDETCDASNSTTETTELPGTTTGKSAKMAIVFTCSVCGTRSAKQFTKNAYDNGVVMVRCPGCTNIHLISDRLGFFEDESWDVEKALQNMGDKVKKVTNDNVLEVTMKDVIGDAKVDEMVRQHDKEPSRKILQANSDDDN